ncbi:hypothetical protein ASG32_29260 [Methylobacterium sp. Leaf361]|nr:hypothetical protein ASG32_29260 [Methylobacterium sp. Leaf361]
MGDRTLSGTPLIDPAVSASSRRRILRVRRRFTSARLRDIQTLPVPAASLELVQGLLRRGR